MECKSQDTDTAPPTTRPAASEPTTTAPTTTEPAEPTVAPTPPEENVKPDEGGLPVVAVVAIIVLASGGVTAGVIL